MEVKLVHPSDPEKKVVTATDEQQVAAYRNHGFVEEGDLADSTDASPEAHADTEELARLKAENKALRTENTKLKNKINKTDESGIDVDPEKETK